ncbi:MAG: TRAP transporter large permease subunit [Wenzhouxiangellaceae bacterium]
MMEALPSLLLFAGLLLALMAGYPVAFTLAGVSLLAAGIGILTGTFDAVFLNALPNRLYGLMINQTLVAVPAFVFMGSMLERSGLAEELLLSMEALLGNTRNGLSLAVIVVGALLAASTGIVGATVVTMGMLALPSMLQRGYSPRLAAGSICAAGTLGQIIPPSIALVLLGDVLANAYQQAQISSGVFNTQTVSVGDLFAGALIPGLLLVLLYIVYAVLLAPRVSGAGGQTEPQDNAGDDAQVSRPQQPGLGSLLLTLLAPLLLIVLVLGSIFMGAASPTEAAAVGAVGATALAAIKRRLSKTVWRQVVYRSAQITSMVFMILIAASLFALVFRGFGGDRVVTELLGNLPGGVFTAMLVVMLVIFVLGFMLDFIEITYVVVPIVAPVLLAMGVSPIWLGIMIAVNLQTSFLTPPFGFALFYLRGVASQQLSTSDLYRGVLPFIVLQLLVLGLLAVFPALATWLPQQLG